MIWRIAPLTACRVTELAACHIASWREAYGTLVPEHVLAGFDLDRSAITWERRRADGEHRIPVAVVADQLVGFAAATDTELEALYVRAAWHGTGVADALIEAAAPGSPCTLWVFGDYPRAHAFYRRHGFADTGERKVDPFTLLPEQLWRRAHR
ncbi:GNAT family N-acetyltransferase [Nocardia mangyaensis]|uniref:GNAT family N-acetyltransferase n=1 Tax=Nocardia mangyaensis TaxID=2213200 RepID=UPI002674CED4|nr:GNAT family N-acetyltransferase [Nocardia mangyaensis]MDO3645993.1 GNAT family N-acetyltransferase [Nocardia mangyaensis]